MTTASRCLIASFLLLAACAGSDGDDVPAQIDAPNGTPIDAPNGTPIDAPNGTPIDAPNGTAGIGSACTGENQGTCPTGFVCLNLQGGSGSWCSKRCTDVNDQSCAVGYAGPGYAACLLRVTPAGGGEPQSHCTVLCFDAPGSPTYCPGGAAQCNNTCPTPLMCTADIGSPAQARLCQ